jgi:arylsulfatase A-like enzyme
MARIIHRRDAIRGLLGAAAAPGILHGARRPGDKPNLLFLWTDQQRANTLGIYGNPRFRVPNLNRLASNSVVFGRCYDTQPVCTPARSSVMTGMWPHQNGCLNNNLHLRPDAKTFPELIGDSAYRTGYMGKWHLGDEVFAQRGFEQWVSIEDIYINYYSPGRDRAARSSYHHFLARHGLKPDSKEGTFTRDFEVQRPFNLCKPSFLAGEATDFIFKNRAEPWMLYVNFLEPHPPYFGPLNDLYSDREAPIPANYPGVGIEREPEHYAKIRKAQRVNVEKSIVWYATHEQKYQEGTEERFRAALRRLNLNYAGNTSMVDIAIGRILSALEASGQADNTIIVFTSDHGEMGGAHSLIQKSVMFEEAMHVPMMLRIPFRQSRQVVYEQPVSHIDLTPTLYQLMTGKDAENLPGESWTGLFEGEPRREDHVYVQWNETEDGPNARTVISPDGWKLALHDRDNCLLFQRDRDPLEMTNLYYRRDHAPVVRRLRSRIEKWQSRVGDKLALPEPSV